MTRAGYWNHNERYQPEILDAVPPGCGAALEVGCIKDPEMIWAEVRARTSSLLPGVRYRRHLLWRYSLLWRKPCEYAGSEWSGRDPLADQAAELDLRRQVARTSPFLVAAESVRQDGPCTFRVLGSL